MGTQYDTNKLRFVCYFTCVLNGKKNYNPQIVWTTLNLKWNISANLLDIQFALIKLFISPVTQDFMGINQGTGVDNATLFGNIPVSVTH